MIFVRVAALLLSAIALASCRARSHPSAYPGSYGPQVKGTECEPAWTTNIPRDGESFYFADLGTGSSRELAMDRARGRFASELVSRVSAWAVENAVYVKRHGSRAATDSSVRTISTEAWASGAELIARSRLCEIPEGFSVWELRRISARLVFKRLADNDSLAADIDFSAEIRNALRRP